RAMTSVERRGQRVERRGLSVETSGARIDRAVVERLAERSYLYEDRVESAAFGRVDHRGDRRRREQRCAFHPQCASLLPRRGRAVHHRLNEKDGTEQKGRRHDEMTCT